MGVPRDDPVVGSQPRRAGADPERRGGALGRRTAAELADGEVVRLPQRRESAAMRLERERRQRERLITERIERRRQARLEQLRRDREEMRQARHATRRVRDQRPRAQVRPRVAGPVRKRERAAENRRRVAARRRGLLWPTAKAGVAATLVLAFSAAVGSVLGLPVPGLGNQDGRQSLLNSAAVFGVDPGTPTGLAPGYVFPLIGTYDFGTKIDRFGAPRAGHMHEGQDIFGKVGTPEVAVHDGVVVDRGKNTDPDSGGRGNFLTIYSPRDNHSFVYMHMLKPARVLVGQQVHAGEQIGLLGCSGSCDGPHLHFEVRVGRATPGADTKPIDPLAYLRQWPQATPGK
jgi:murein DD-endopeptidase MepM/ murein hydrolase activator NlpD